MVDDPSKRVYFRTQLPANEATSDAEDDLNSIVEACGNILSASGFDRDWPPKTGNNVLIEHNEEQSAAWYAAQAILHTRSALIAIDKNDAKKAVYNAMRAQRSSEIAFSRHSGLEHATWSGAKSISKAGTSHDDRRIEIDAEDRRLLKIFEEIISVNGKRGAVRRLAASELNKLKHKVTDVEVGRYSKKVSRAKARQKTK